MQSRFVDESETLEKVRVWQPSVSRSLDEAMGVTGKQTNIENSHPPNSTPPQTVSVYPPSCGFHQVFNLVDLIINTIPNAEEQD